MFSHTSFPALYIPSIYTKRQLVHTIVYYEHNGMYKLSFRTAKEHVNVSEIAGKLYNGGGHAKAAGATIPKKPFYDSLI